jgi:hypothetical protein
MNWRGPRAHQIATADLGLLSLTDDVDEAVDVIVRISDDT